MNIARNSKAQLVAYYSEVAVQSTTLQRWFSSSVVSSVILGAASQSFPSNSKCSSSRHKANERQRKETQKATNQLKRAQWSSKGKYGGKYYNSQKPRDWGLEIHCLCDYMNGYIFSLTFPIMEGTKQRVIYPGLPFTSWTIILWAQILHS